MANTLKFKRGLLAGLPAAAEGEPLFTTDTKDLYIGTSSGNQRFQKYIASGTTSQLLRGDGSLLTMPIVLISPSSGQVLKFNGTNWVNSSDADTGITTLNTLTALTQTFATGTSGTDFNISSATSTHTFNLPSASATNRGLLTSSDWTTFNNKQNALTNPVTGTGVSGQVAYWSGTNTQVGSNNLFWDATNNRLGIGTNVPTQRLDVSGYIRATSGFVGNSGLQLWADNSSLAAGARLTTGGNFIINNPSVDNGLRFQVTGDGSFTGQVNSAFFYTTATSSPSGQEGLRIANNNGYIGFFNGANSTRSAYIQGNTTDLTINTSLATPILFGTSNVEKMRLDASGNLGLGVVPSAWGSAYKAFQIGASAGLFGSSGQVYLASNQYIDSSFSERYVVSDFATHYRQISGQHRWYNAPSGTAGNAITFTQAMTLTANGRLLLGTTSDTGELLQVNGTMRVSGASTFGGAMTGTSATFSGQITVNGGGASIVNSTNSATLQLNKANTTAGQSAQINFIDNSIIKFALGAFNIGSANANDFSLYNYTTASNNFTIAASTGAATFSSSVGSTLGSGGIYFSGDATPDIAYIGYNYTNVNGTEAVSQSFRSSWRQHFGNGSTNSWKLAFRAANAAASSFTDYLTIASTGAATFSSSVTAASVTANDVSYFKKLTSAAQQQIRLQTVADSYAGQWAFGNSPSSLDLSASYYNGTSWSTNFFELSTTGAATFSSSIQAATAIAIGTTPDTNKPFKILKNINATVGINFENTSTGSSAFSAIQMGTDVTGGTKFTNLVYASSGVTANGVYQPDGTSLINNGSGGLNFLGNPIRMYTGGSNGTLRWDMTNDGFITQYTGTNPSTNATDGYRQYSADVVAGNAAPHFRTENGAVVKIYQETTAVGNSIISLGGGNAVLDDTTFDGYTLRQIVKALRNQGILA